jgi:guanylate kinase
METISSDMTGRLIVLSGPSCVGKSPLSRALGKFYPDLHNRLQKLVLFNSRAPRPGEAEGVDYYFRTRSQVESLREDSRYAVLNVRGDLQAVDVQQIEALLRRGDGFFEGNPFVARALQVHPHLADVDKLTMFLSPLSRDEISCLKALGHSISLQELVTDIMRRKLLRRTRRQKGELSAKDLENVEKRASSAFCELQQAWHFQYVIPNHDGEDSDNWEAFYYLIGDARKSLNDMVALLQGLVPLSVEKWEEELLQPAT